MGCFCCCFHVNDHGDSSLNTSHINTFLNKCVSLFKKDHTAAAAPSDDNQEAVSSTSSSPPSDDNTIASQPRMLHKDLEQLRDGDRTSRERDNEVNKLTELESTQCCLGFSIRSSLKKAESEAANSGSEDEDFCPTCLEEYTTENPKIVTQCNHHYHLSCIYEWMERRPTCPVCSKVMVFDETI